MDTSKKKSFFINVFIALFLIFVQYNGYFSLKIGNAVPFLPFAFIIIISMLSSEIYSAFTGLVMGIIIDAISSTSFGFNSIIFPVICLSVTLLVHYLFNNNILASLVLSGAYSVIYFAIRIVLFYSKSSISEMFSYFWSTTIPSVIYTTVIAFLLYIFEKKVIKL